MAEEQLGPPSAVGQIIRYVGGWTQPSGRGIFMFRTLTTSISAAAFTGLGVAYATALFGGPLASIGFIVGSSLGYVAATILYWRTAMQSALVAFDDHPQLLHLHLVRNYPNAGFQRLRMEREEERARFRERLGRDLMLRCYLMSSWHTAAPAIEVSLFWNADGMVLRSF
ncbi:uncharacterized protein LTR77_009417 [Saxophila tyrrhenica]|uniref:Uncharacterized protein n=1 Tax=Saxophila tyrrhenica TaxID=1690608 RepID=A0AAV9P0B8_9PEZI|nr:hypothetical protein LTR77_009417 [Saxophila tyrrhenica]